MQTPQTLTAILPNYNHGPYLSAALDALFAQTRPADELIIIDDASTDNSVEIIESYLPRHPGIQFHRNIRNLGVVEGMNRGLKMARSAVVYFAAADDVTYPGLFAEGMELLAAHPQAALFSARCHIIDKGGRFEQTFPTPMPLSQAGFIDPARAIRSLLQEDSWIVGNTTLYRCDLLVAAGGLSPEFGAFCDGYVSRLLALQHGACYSPSVLCAWRRMEGGMAWSQAMSPAATNEVIRLAEQRMAAAGGVFPPRYIARWKRRHLFGAQRFSIIQLRRCGGRGSAGAFWGRVADAVWIAWLFLSLRPWDLWPVLRRKWRARWSRGDR